MNEEFVDFKNLDIPMDEYEMVCLLKHLDAITKKGTRVRDAYKPYLKYDENKKKILYNVNKKDEFLDKIGLYRKAILMKVDLKKIFDDFNSKSTIDRMGVLIASNDFSIWITVEKKPVFNFKINSTIPYEFDYESKILQWEYDKQVCFAGWKHNRITKRFSRITL